MYKKLGRKNLEKHLHYLKVLEKHYSVMQPEVREAIDEAIKIMESTIDVDINVKEK